MSVPSHPVSRSKRLKVSNACEQCRRKKTKCDDVRPACGNCVRSFGSHAISRCTRKGVAGPSSTSISHRDHRVREETQAQETDDNIEPSVDDGPGTATLGLVDPARRSRAHFGRSSARSFLEHIQAMVDVSDGSPTMPSSANPSVWMHDYLYGQPESSMGTVAPGKALLSRHFADTLLFSYWTSIHPMFPFLDKAQVDSDYHRYWEGLQTVCDPSTFRSIIHTVFAIGCQINQTLGAAEREDLSSRLYSYGLQAPQSSRSTSVASIQASLLSAQYCHSTEDHNQFWLTSGSAARAAISIGLHLPRTSERAPDDRSRQLLRRVWHGCVLLDRIAALTYGRPISIQECDVPLPERKVPHDLSEQNIDPGSYSSPTTDVTVFVETAKMYRIFHQALSGTYPLHVQGSAIEDLLTYLSSPGLGPPTGRLILSLDYELMEWRKGLPEHLQSPPNDVNGLQMLRQYTVLQQRYLFLKIVSLRPILSAFVHSETKRPDSVASTTDFLAYRFAKQAAILCTELAQEAIALVHDHLVLRPDVGACLSEWWYNVLYVYTSAAVLVAAQLLTVIAGESLVDGLNESWTKVQSVFEIYQTRWRTSARLPMILKLLYEGVPRKYLELKESRRVCSEVATGSTVPTSSTANEHAVSEEVFPEGAAHSYQEYDASWNLDPFLPNFDLDDMSWLNDLPTWEE